MYCSRCGKENTNQAAYCAACGAALGQAMPKAPVRPRTSGLALASLSLGILGIFTGVAAIPGLILGIIARWQIRRSQGRLNGKELAAGGIVSSSIGLVVGVFILFPLYLRLREEAHYTLCMGNVKRITMTLKTYAGDYDQRYPTLHVGSTAGGRWELLSLEVWPYMLDPYITGSKFILACPNAERIRHEPFTYFFNRRLSGRSMGKVVHPSECIVIGDWVPYGWLTEEKSTTWDIARSKQSRPSGSWEAADQHSPGAIYGFVDGHAKLLRRNDILPVPPEATKPPAGYESEPSMWP